MLFKEAQSFYIPGDDLEISLMGNEDAIDATTIDLCLFAFCRATFSITKAGINRPTLPDLKMFIPEFILFTTTPVHDKNVLGVIRFEANSFYTIDS